MIKGVNDPDNNTALVDFTYDAALGKITVEIENTASGDDPRITGFAFNTPSNVTGVSAFTASGTQDDTQWTDVYDPNGIDTPGNFGMFDLAGFSKLSGGNPINGGSAANGIDDGDTATFMFTLTGADLNTLTEASFLSLFSEGGNQNAEHQYFAVRFQRTGLCSDNEPDCAEGSDIGFPMEQVPVPASLPLLFTAMLGLGFLGRRRMS